MWRHCRTVQALLRRRRIKKWREECRADLCEIGTRDQWLNFSVGSPCQFSARQAFLRVAPVPAYSISYFNFSVNFLGGKGQIMISSAGIVADRSGPPLASCSIHLCCTSYARPTRWPTRLGTPSPSAPLVFPQGKAKDKTVAHPSYFQARPPTVPIEPHTWSQQQLRVCSIPRRLQPVPTHCPRLPHRLLQAPLLQPSSPPISKLSRRFG